MRYAIALSCLLLVAPTVQAHVPASDLVDADGATEEGTDTTPQPRGDGSLKAAMLQGHNAVRQALGVAALAWDDRLAADATRYAQQLAATHRFQHAARVAGEPVEGENLWMGTSRAYAYRDMAGSWIEEGQSFVPGTFPNLSRTGSWHDVGHFTQMIWGGTRALGCGMAANAEDEVLVCRYFPAGNVWGENPLRSVGSDRPAVSPHGQRMAERE